MNLKLADDWQELLKNEFEKEYFKELSLFVSEAYKNKICYPPQHKIFEAFNLCKFNDLKVVIIGQDPYHDVGQAHGLSFSVNDGVVFPPSLKNIFKELENDLAIKTANSGNLEKWAKQGVLLLNATLTVEEHAAGSHQNKGWEKFTDAVISLISAKKNNVVFLLWGGYAKKKGRKIDAQKHCILTSGHPSPLSANRGYWFGNKHFSKANKYLMLQRLNPINW